MPDINNIQTTSTHSISNQELIKARDNNGKITHNGVNYKVTSNLDVQVSGKLNKLYSQFSQLLDSFHISKGKRINSTLSELKTRLNEISKQADIQESASTPTTKSAGYPLQLQNLPEKGTAIVEYYDHVEDEFATKEIEVNNKSSLTNQLLQHFSPIDDGVYGFFGNEEDDKDNIFDITKITIPDSEGVEHSVYFPEKKPGDYKHFKELFDSVPVDIKDINHIVTPDNYNQELNNNYGFDYAVHNGLHVIQQGTTSACGPTSLAMVLMDKEVDISKLQHQVMDAHSGMFIDNLHHLASEYTNTEFYDKSPNMLQTLKDNLQSDGLHRAAIVTYGPHFIVVDSVNDNKISIRDPYQGTLSEIALDSFDTSKFGKGIIFFPKN